MGRVHRSSSRGIMVLIQEPWLSGTKIRGLGHYNLFQGIGNNSRACIITTPGINAWQLNDFCSEDVVAVAISGTRGGNQYRTVFASVYMSHGGTVPPVKMGELVRYCEINSLPLILGSDVNAHHQMWGSTDINGRGEELLEYLASTSLSWANRGHKPTFVTRNRQEVLDLTLYSDEASGMIDNWHVSDEPSLSDHKYLKFQVNLGVTKPPLQRFVRNTNWTIYRHRLSHHLAGSGPGPDTLINREHMETVADQVTACMVAAWEDACPITRGQRSTSQKWWTPELARERTQVRSLLRRACRVRSDEAWDEYQASHRQYKYNLRKTKRKSWFDFCSKTESMAATAKLCKILKKDGNCKLGCIEKSDGGYTLSPEETLRHMVETHIHTDNVRTGGAVTHEENAPNGLIDNIVNARKTKLAVFRCEPYKAPGMDGIYPAMLQHGWGDLCPWISQLFRASIQMGYIPKCWRKAKGLFLPKPGKDSYAKAKSFRMITLTSYQLKILERLILWYLGSGEDIDGKLHHYQYGFRKGRSTEAALHQLVHRLEENYIKGDLSMGIFLDIEGAFDKVPFRVIEEAAVSKGIDKYIV